MTDASEVDEEDVEMLSELSWENGEIFELLKALERDENKLFCAGQMN